MIVSFLVGLGRGRFPGNLEPPRSLRWLRIAAKHFRPTDPRDKRHQSAEHEHVDNIAMQGAQLRDEGARADAEEGYRAEEAGAWPKQQHGPDNLNGAGQVPETLTKTDLTELRDHFGIAGQLQIGCGEEGDSEQALETPYAGAGPGTGRHTRGGLDRHVEVFPFKGCIAETARERGLARRP